MNIGIYSMRDDEADYVHQMAESLGIHILTTSEDPSVDNVDFLEGCEGVSVLGQVFIGRELLDAWKEKGIRYLSTRTIGYNHIDVKYAGKIGIRVSHASYDPNGVADFTIMLMLMCLRNYKQALWRGQVNDFSLFGLKGKEMRSLTVGVVGTGKIGAAVIKNLSGFGCKILAYGRHESDELKQYATYVSLEELYHQSDIITLHLPLTPETKHMINHDTIAMMKDQVIIINCARGSLADPDALIEGIESEKIGALGLDVLEREEGIIHVDHRIDIISNQKMAYLRQFRNVTMTPHMAFYTEEAVKSMVETGILGLLDMQQHEKGKLEVV